MEGVICYLNYVGRKWWGLVVVLGNDGGGIHYMFWDGVIPGFISCVSPNFMHADMIPLKKVVSSMLTNNN